MVATPVLAFRLLLGMRCGPCVMIAQSSHSPPTLQLLTDFLLGVALDFQMCEAWRPDYQSTRSGCTRHRTSWGGEETGWECLSNIFPPSSHSWWWRSWNKTLTPSASAAEMGSPYHSPHLSPGWLPGALGTKIGHQHWQGAKNSRDRGVQNHLWPPVLPG